MTTKWADGFEDTAAADLATDYSLVGVPTLVTGRRVGTTAVACNPGVSVRRTIGGTEATIFQSAAVNFQSFNATPSAGRHFMRFIEGTTVHLSLFALDNGAIAVYRGDFVTLLGTSAAFFALSNWKWLQVKAVISDTVGSVEIRDASGVVILALSAIDTRNAGSGYCDTVSLGSTGGTAGNAAYFDDWHVWDGTGTICNTWTNDTRIDHRLPTGPGNSAQFTSSSGANWSAVDEVTFNTTDYVESATAGQKDTYAFGDITHSPPSIFSVVMTAVGQKDDAGARALKLVARSGGADYAGAATTLNQGSYTRAVDVREVDPATGAAWTQTGYNAAEIGFENV